MLSQERKQRIEEQRRIKMEDMKRFAIAIAGTFLVIPKLIY